MVKRAAFIGLVFILLGVSFGAGYRTHYASPTNQAVANLTPAKSDPTIKVANPDTGAKRKTIALRAAKCKFQWAIDRLDGGGQLQCIPIGSPLR